MTITYYLTPHKPTENYSSEKPVVPLVTKANGEPQMISYLCHIPGKLSFTVTATSVSQVYNLS